MVHLFSISGYTAQYFAIEIILFVLQHVWAQGYLTLLPFRNDWTFGVTVSVTAAWSPLAGAVLPWLLLLGQTMAGRAFGGRDQMVSGELTFGVAIVPSVYFLVQCVVRRRNQQQDRTKHPTERDGSGDGGGGGFMTIILLITLHLLCTMHACGVLLVRSLIFPAPSVARSLPTVRLWESNRGKLDDRLKYFVTMSQNRSTFQLRFPQPMCSSLYGPRWRSTSFLWTPATCYQPQVMFAVVRYADGNESNRSSNAAGVIQPTMTAAGGLPVATVLSDAPSSVRRPKWMVYIGGNGEVMEANLPTVAALGHSWGVHVVSFNFQGVASSQGLTTGSASMVADAVAVIDAIQERYDVLERDIIVFGHSIGGGVAAQVVAHHKKNCSLVLDRTFSSLVDATRPFVPAPLWLSSTVVNGAFGDFATGETLALLSHDRWAVTFHRSDAIIPYDISSLARLPMFSSGNAHASKLVELQGYPCGDVHNCDLPDFDVGFAELKLLIRRWLEAGTETA